MLNGYLQIRVMAQGRYADCWQQIEAGAVVGHVNDAGQPIELPEPHEAVCLTGQLHFAPGVLLDPAAAQPEPRVPLFGPDGAAPAPPAGEG